MNGSDRVTRMASDEAALERIVKNAFEMPSVMRKVFLFCDIRGLTVAEAAAILGISFATVTVQLDRARRELNVRLAVTS